VFKVLRSSSSKLEASLKAFLSEPLAALLGVFIFCTRSNSERLLLLLLLLLPSKYGGTVDFCCLNLLNIELFSSSSSSSNLGVGILNTGAVLASNATTDEGCADGGCCCSTASCLKYLWKRPPTSAAVLVVVGLLVTAGGAGANFDMTIFSIL